jgi:hypothetical protein
VATTIESESIDKRASMSTNFMVFRAWRE